MKGTSRRITVRDYSKAAKHMWNQLQVGEKEFWAEMAAIVKRIHHIIYPEYKYQPRRDTSLNTKKKNKIDVIRFRNQSLQEPSYLQNESDSEVEQISESNSSAEESGSEFDQDGVFPRSSDNIEPSGSSSSETCVDSDNVEQIQYSDIQYLSSETISPDGSESESQSEFENGDTYSNCIYSPMTSAYLNTSKSSSSEPNSRSEAEFGENTIASVWTFPDVAQGGLQWPMHEYETGNTPQSDLWKISIDDDNDEQRPFPSIISGNVFDAQSIDDLDLLEASSFQTNSTPEANNPQFMVNMIGCFSSFPDQHLSDAFSQDPWFP